MESEKQVIMAVHVEAQRKSATDEAETLKCFAAGDLSAFEALFRQYQTHVFGWIVRLVRDTGAAEDLVIETFWRIYRARGRFDPQRSFGAWARRIATNVAIDYLKKAPLEENLPDDVVSANETDSDLSQHIRRQIERAFHSLPAKFQAVATLALIEERPYEEIAEAFGISVGAVKSRVFRAVRLLRKKLRQLGVEP